MTQAFFPKYLTGCASHSCIVGGIMVSMSMSSFLKPMMVRIFQPLLFQKCVPYLGLLTSQDQTSDILNAYNRYLNC